MQTLETLPITSWEETLSEEIQQQAIQSLEKGKILFMPSLSFPLKPDELQFLSSKNVDPKRKNISYSIKTAQLGGSLWNGTESDKLKDFLLRYAEQASSLLKRLFPHYASDLAIEKTSFRPIEIYGRKSSIHKDDTRLHIDAFPSNPTQGRRILRFFTNINPDGKPRIWKVGEPFEEVARKFICKVPRYSFLSSYLLKLLKITKKRRTFYDHYMLHIHNEMKEDTFYQETAQQEEIHFPAGSSWIVFTDQVSHAALAGQHVLEQTFSLPTASLQDISSAPLNVLEKII
jgi:hypothetical protein